MKKKSNQYLLLFFNVLFICAILYNLFRLYNYKDYNNDSNLIVYSIISYKENSGGKGNHYDMDILYDGETHTLSITGREYREIKKGVYTKVYRYNGELLTDWTYEQKKRYIYVFLILLIFTNVAFYLNRKRTKKINFSHSVFDTESHKKLH